jgi:hypothetical protein
MKAIIFYLLRTIRHLPSITHYWLLCCIVTTLLSACASSKCECETNNKYSKRKSKVSLINYQKTINFAVQKDRSYS